MAPVLGDSAIEAVGGNNAENCRVAGFDSCKGDHS